MNLRTPIAALFALSLTPTPALADVSLAPFAGFRMSSSVDIETAGASTSDQIDFRDSASQGLVFNFDLAEPGKQGELYFGRQSTSARSCGEPCSPGRRSRSGAGRTGLRDRAAMASHSGGAHAGCLQRRHFHSNA